MRIVCKTGETVHSLKRYYETEHWIQLTLSYNQSDLTKRCFKCKTQCSPSHFLHRTKKRIGNEKLTDLLPVCAACINAKPEISKKKNERMLLAPLGFRSYQLTDEQKIWLCSIKPKLRGHILGKYFSQKAIQYKPSKVWINIQVKKACKWIRKQEKEMRISLESV